MDVYSAMTMKSHYNQKQIWINGMKYFEINQMAFFCELDRDKFASASFVFKCLNGTVPQALFVIN